MVNGLLTWINTQNLTTKILVFLTAVLILSPLGSNKLLSVGGVFAPELFVGLLIIFKLKEFNLFLSMIRNSLTYILVVLACIILTYIGYLSGGDIAVSYSLLRAFVFFCLGWMLVNYLFTYQLRPLNLLVFLTVISTIGSLIYFIIFSSGVKAPYSIPLMLLVFYFAYLSKSSFIILISISILFLMAVTSSFRVYWVYSVLFLLAFLFGYLKNIIFIKNNVFYLNLTNFLVISILLIVIPLSFILLSDFVFQWFSADSGRYNQIVWKSQELYNAIIYGGEVDASTYIRMLQFEYFKDNWVDFLLPTGFHDNTDFLGNSSAIRDGIYYYMAIIFGLLLSVVMCSVLVFKLFLNIARSKSEKLPRFVICIVLFIIFCINGSSLTVISQSFYLGVLLSIMIKPELTVCRKEGIYE